MATGKEFSMPDPSGVSECTSNVKELEGVFLFLFAKTRLQPFRIEKG